MVAARSPPSKVPSGVSELALATAARTSSRLMPIEAAATGLTRMRMAGCSAPLTVTSATPSIWAMRWATSVSATSYIVLASSVCEVSARIMIGAADGLTLRMAGKRRQVARQVGRRGVEGRLHVARGAVDAAVEIELDGDAGGAERARRGDLGDAGNFAEPALQRRRHRRRHHGRIGAGPARGNPDGRIFHRRHAGDRQEAVGHHAGEKQPDREQRGADRAKDEGFGEAHGAALGRRKLADTML